VQRIAVRQRLVVASRQGAVVPRHLNKSLKISSSGALMAQSSAYSYTERKRIRKSFGNRDSVVEIPYLLQMQKDAYTAFLQAGIAPKQRTVEGLQAAFDAAFPIVSHNGFVEMKFLEYKPGEACVRRA
jgi:hypothetical protein